MGVAIQMEIGQQMRMGLDLWRIFLLWVSTTPVWVANPPKSSVDLLNGGLMLWQHEEVTQLKWLRETFEVLHGIQLEGWVIEAKSLNAATVESVKQFSSQPLQTSSAQGYLPF